MTEVHHASARRGHGRASGARPLPVHAHLRRRRTVQFVRGEGSRLWDRDGKEYLDFLSGLAVTSLGHAHPEVADALAEQARTLLHVSNLFGTEPGRGRSPSPSTASRRRRPGVLLQLGRRGQRVRHQAGPASTAAAGTYQVVSAFGSFHGRTLATLHATGQPQKHEAFQPLPEGFRHVAWNDLDALEAAIDPSVAAVLLEPVQGEGGVNPATAEYFEGVRRLCDERGLLFMVDEVQTGLGRTGEWFGFQHFGVEPDVVTMAKALGNGVPIGACWARARRRRRLRARRPRHHLRRPAPRRRRGPRRARGDGARGRAPARPSTPARRLRRPARGRARRGRGARPRPAARRRAGRRASTPGWWPPTRLDAGLVRQRGDAHRAAPRPAAHRHRRRDRRGRRPARRPSSAAAWRRSTA